MAMVCRQFLPVWAESDSFGRERKGWETRRDPTFSAQRAMCKVSRASHGSRRDGDVQARENKEKMTKKRATECRAASVVRGQKDRWPDNDWEEVVTWSGDGGGEQTRPGEEREKSVRGDGGILGPGWQSLYDETQAGIFGAAKGQSCGGGWTLDDASGGRYARLLVAIRRPDGRLYRCGLVVQSASDLNIACSQTGQAKLLTARAAAARGWSTRPWHPPELPARNRRHDPQPEPCGHG
jgi:hypothetical protein